MAYKKYGFWGCHVEGGYSYKYINEEKKKIKSDEKYSKFHGAVDSDGTYHYSFEKQTPNSLQPEPIPKKKLKKWKQQKAKK